MDVQNLKNLIIKEMSEKEGIKLENMKYIDTGVLSDSRCMFSAKINGQKHKVKYTRPWVYYYKEGETPIRAKNVHIG